MEDKVQLGTVGELDLQLTGGKASLTLTAALPMASASATVSVVVDAGDLVDKLFAAIESKSPAGVVVLEEGVKAVIKAAVMAI